MPPSSVRRHVAPFALAFAAAAIASHAEAATENGLAPPEVLQYPPIASPNAPVEVPMGVLRRLFDDAANWQLCAILLKDAKQPIPTPADWAHCPEPYKTKVKSHQGKVHWVTNGEPSKCGTNCWARPQNNQEQNRDRPNTNYSSVGGSLVFELEVPNSPNRNVTFPFDVVARCKMSPTNHRDGEAELRVVFQRPIVGDPSFLESALDFFTPVNWSRQVEDGIRSQLSTPGSTGIPLLARCSSMAASIGSDPSLDAFRYDPPRAAPRTPIATAATARVRFTKVTRKPPPFGYTPPAETGTFMVYLNGIGTPFPSYPAITLPPTGGSANIAYCKTIPMDGADRLQVLFTNSQGGAAWGQWNAAEKFGEGAHTLLLGHQIAVKAPQGSPPGTKPGTIVLRDYELSYAVDYSGGLMNEPSSGTALAKAAPVTKRLGDLSATIEPLPCKEL